MNKKNLIIFTLPIMWLIYFLFELFSGRIKTSNILIGNILLIFIFILVGYIVYKITNKFTSGLTKRKLWIIFIILMIIDQGTKIIIKLFFFDSYKEIIKNFLSFNPIINTHGSWLNARFGTGINFPILILLNLIAIFLFIQIYKYSKFKGIKDIYSDLSFLFIIAGSLCSLIDKTFYGGSLDFIGIGTLFIADIKDIYINLGMFFLIISLYGNNFFQNNDTTLREDINNLKKFFNFIKNNFNRKNK